MSPEQCMGLIALMAEPMSIRWESCSISFLRLVPTLCQHLGSRVGFCDVAAAQRSGAAHADAAGREGHRRIPRQWRAVERRAARGCLCSCWSDCRTDDSGASAESSKSIRRSRHWPTAQHAHRSRCGCFRARAWCRSLGRTDHQRLSSGSQRSGVSCCKVSRPSDLSSLSYRGHRLCIQRRWKSGQGRWKTPRAFPIRTYSPKQSPMISAPLSDKSKTS
jgi:hypothetical protein